jgi:hypothetical protein
MEKEIYDRAVLARRYPEFAEHFMQGDVLILEDGKTKRIIKFPNSGFHPELSFVRHLLNDFFLEFYREEDIPKSPEGIFSGTEVVIDISPQKK